MTVYSSDISSKYKDALKKYGNLEETKGNKYFNKIKNGTKGFLRFLYEGAKDIPIEIKEKIPNSKDDWKGFLKRYWPSMTLWSAYIGLNIYYHSDPNYLAFTKAGITTVGSIKPFFRKSLSNPAGELAEENFRNLHILETNPAQILIGIGVTAANVGVDYWRSKRIQE